MSHLEPGPDDVPATFVLVHGAWTGGYVWQGVRDALSRAGHLALAPTLTGLGERVHLASESVDLTTHVHDVANVLRYEDLTDVVLVAHSYGGVVATAVADRLPQRIRHLVLVDALVPRDGESVDDLRGRRTTSWVMPPGLRELGADAAARAMGLTRLSRQPPRTFSEAVSLAEPLEARAFRRSYVRPTGRRPSPAYDRAAAHARTHPGWTYHRVTGDHDVITRGVGEVSRLLRELVRPDEGAR